MCAFSSHVTLHTCTLFDYILLYVCLCRVIRFPNMFRNVRACTIVCLVLREGCSRRLPWLLLGFTTFGESAVMIDGLGRRMKPPFWSRGLWSDSAVRSAVWPPIWNRRFIPDAFIILGLCSAVYSAVSKPPNETAVFSHVLRMNSVVMIGGLAAEWNRRIRYFRSVSFSGSILRSDSAAPTAELNRRLSVFRGNLVFSHALFLMTIYIILSHFSNLVLWF